MSRAPWFVRLFDVSVDVAPALAYHVVYPAHMQGDPRTQKNGPVTGPENGEDGAGE